MATHSSILAWKIPSTEEPGWLQSMGCKESDVTERTGYMHMCTHTLISTPLSDLKLLGDKMK